MPVIQILNMFCDLLKDDNVEKKSTLHACLQINLKLNFTFSSFIQNFLL